jgi:hypothetical protein
LQKNIGISKFHVECKIFLFQVIGQGSKNAKGNFQILFAKPPSFYYLFFWADVTNSCWLAATLAHPAQSYF